MELRPSGQQPLQLFRPTCRFQIHYIYDQCTAATASKVHRQTSIAQKSTSAHTMDNSRIRLPTVDDMLAADTHMLARYEQCYGPVRTTNTSTTPLTPCDPAPCAQSSAQVTAAVHEAPRSVDPQNTHIVPRRLMVSIAEDGTVNYIVDAPDTAHSKDSRCASHDHRPAPDVVWQDFLSWPPCEMMGSQAKAVSLRAESGGSGSAPFRALRRWPARQDRYRNENGESYNLRCGPCTMKYGWPRCDWFERASRLGPDVAPDQVICTRCEHEGRSLEECKKTLRGHGGEYTAWQQESAQGGMSERSNDGLTSTSAEGDGRALRWHEHQPK